MSLLLFLWGGSVAGLGQILGMVFWEGRLLGQTGSHNIY